MHMWILRFPLLNITIPCSGENTRETWLTEKERVWYARNKWKWFRLHPVTWHTPRYLFGISVPTSPSLKVANPLERQACRIMPDYV